MTDITFKTTIELPKPTYSREYIYVGLQSEVIGYTAAVYAMSGVAYTAAVYAMSDIAYTAAILYTNVAI